MNRRLFTAFVGTCAAVAFAGMAFSPAASASQVRVVSAKKHATSAPLRDIQWNLPPIMQRITNGHKLSQEKLDQLRAKLVKAGFLKPLGQITQVPMLRKRPASPPVKVRDTALQQSMARRRAPEAFTTPMVSFDGVGKTLGYTPGFYPPDMNAATGDNYVVETVNIAFAVFNKSDGSLALGPADISSLWSGFGGVCENNADGDPVVLFDHMSHRWVVTQFAGSSVPTDECIAVSQTGDPTGSYYLYDFAVAPSDFADYPKLGVWSDGYYATFNIFNSSGTAFVGVDFVAFERSAMLNGSAAQMVVIQNTNTYSVLPADLDGQAQPPSGSPEYFLNYVSPYEYGSGAPYALGLWTMSVDWSNPSAATLNGPTLVNVDPFNDGVCNGARNCIPQPNTAPGLDAITDRPMYRLAYRNFGDHEAMVVNQTVGLTDTNPPTGVRWYELDTSSPGANDWSVAQQSTFGPSDGSSRWMGSMAMDHSGNIALGYSVSSSSVEPSIAYTGRLATDPANTMTQPETILQAGGGEQTGSAGRWGDYTSMSVDPLDDCTFWYTNEYYDATSAVSWSTHIGSFKFANCTQGPHGTLSGTVTDSSNSMPIAGASVTITPGNIVTRTDDAGTYAVDLPTGSYTAVASDFGYQSSSQSVTISDGTTTTQDFSLAPAPTAVLSGTVTDGSGQGYGLYAEVKISAAGFGQVADVWTDPTDGGYTVSLPVGNDYTINVHTVLDGYNTGSANVTLNGDTVQDFALTITAACTAPGYAFQGMGQDFDGGGFPPTGWTVTHTPSNSVQWMLSSNEPIDNGNYTGGTGNAADADSNDYGVGAGSYDTSLITAPTAVTSLPAGSAVLKYKANFYVYSGNEALDLDISTDGGTTWTTISHWTTNHGSLYSTPGVDVQQDLSSYLPATGSFELRWRYYNPVGDYDWYAQIDDVQLGSCQPVAGGLIEGAISDANTGNGLTGATVSDNGGSAQSQTNAADPNLPGGYYIVFGAEGSQTVTASKTGYQDGTASLTVAAGTVTTQNFALKAGVLSGTPTSFDMHMMINTQVQKTFTVANSGSAPGHYKILAINAPAPSTTPPPAGPFATPPRYDHDRNLATLTACDPDQGNCSDGGAGGKGANLPQPRAGGPKAAGDVVSSFQAGIAMYGLGVDHNADDLWLGSPSYSGLGGDDKDHQFMYDGTNTGNTIDTSGFQGLYMADAAFDDNTGMLWQLNVGNSGSCIWELDPNTMQATGNSICPAFPQSERGLAYDPLTNTWYAGDFNSQTIYHFDASGQILDSANVALAVQGLAFNSATGHLFVLTSGGTHAVYVLDAKNNYAQLSSFDITGFNTGSAGAGFGYDCNDNLWVSDYADGVVLQVDSGESGFCSFKGIPWLTVAPKTGTVANGASADVALNFDGTGQAEFTTSEAQLKLTSDTPYPSQTVPLTIHWDPQPVALQVTAQANPDPAKPHDYVVFTINVTNATTQGDGAATQAHMTFDFPAGMTYVAQQGDPCVDNSGSMDCTMGTVAQGDTHTMVIVAQTTTKGKYDITFTATAREPQDSSVPNTADLSGRVGKKSSGGGGGIGGFGWLGLAGLLGLAMAGTWLRGRRV